MKNKILTLFLVSVFLVSLASASEWTGNLNDGLIAYYSFDNSGDSATNLTDVYSGIYNLTNTGDPEIVAGKVGNGAYMDGDDYFSAVLDYGSNFEDDEITMCEWINISVLDGSHEFVLPSVKDNFNNWFYGRFETTTNEWVLQAGSSSPADYEYILAPDSISTDTYYFVCMRFFGNQGDGYISVNVDGLNISATEYQGSTGDPEITWMTSDITFLVATSIGGTSSLNGIVDEVGVWNRALSDEEITALYNEGNGLSYSVNMEIISPTNITYSTDLIDINYIVSNLTELDSCWYSLDSGVTFSETQTCGTNWTGVTANEGSNELIVYGNDTNGVVGSDSIFYSVDTTSPNVAITFPVNATHYNEVIDDLIYTITDANLDSCWYSLDEGATNVSFTCGNLIDDLTIFSNDNHTIYLYANDSVGHESFDEVHFTIDVITPILEWNSPSSDTLIRESGNYDLDVEVLDVYLDAVNLTIYDSNNNIIYENFSDNLLVDIFNVRDNFDLSVGENTIEICARDSAEDSPQIRDLTSLNKSFTEDDEVFLIEKDGVIVSRTTYVINNGGQKVHRQDWNLNITDNWDENGEHLKSDITSDKLQNSQWAIRVDIECVEGCENMELRTDRGRNRIIDDAYEFMFHYDDAVAEGWDVQYTEENGIVSVIIAYPDQTFYDNLGATQTIDPIIGGLNTICESKVITFTPYTEFYKTTRFASAGLGLIIIGITAGLPFLLIGLAFVGIIIAVGMGLKRLFDSKNFENLMR